MMFRRSRFFLLIVLFTMVDSNLMGQQEIRNFDSGQLKEVVEQYNLDYRTRNPDDRLRSWISEKFINIINTVFEWLRDLLQQVGVENPNKVAKVIFYSLLVLIIIYALFRIFKLKPGSFFQSSFQSNNFSPGIDEMERKNYDQLIEDALNEHRLKEAIRYYYLLALQKLHQQNLIEWGDGKTNHEYLQQLESHPVKLPFERISHIYEYIWYGDFPIQDPVIKELQENFSSLNKHIRAKATA